MGPPPGTRPFRAYFADLLHCKDTARTVNTCLCQRSLTLRWKDAVGFFAVRRSRRYLAGLAGVLIALAPGCGMSQVDGAASGAEADDTTLGSPYDDAGYLQGDGAISTGTRFDGGAAPSERSLSSRSPLCNISDDSCVPSTTELTCSDAPADAGPLACRVSVQGSSPVARPVCQAVGQAKDGEKCLRAADCQAGLECVGAPGVCRPYCCDYSCRESTFCSIQRSNAGTFDVPVCMPVSPCQLLGNVNTCSPAETCAVVDTTGQTSCVTIGKSIAGEDCETEPCAKGLTCLGVTGARKCYALCHLAGTGECPGKQVCRGRQQYFTDPSIGICTNN
jgi:hypothetical protein